MAKRLTDHEFLVCEDGIYFGKALKNGNISVDSRRIDEDELVALFSSFVENYCLRNQQPLVIEREGKPFIQATLEI